MGGSAVEEQVLPTLELVVAQAGRRPRMGLGRQTVGAGHFNQLEVPDQVNAMIERFLAVNGLSTRSQVA